MPRFAPLFAALLVTGCQSRPVATDTSSSPAAASRDASLAHALTAHAWTTNDPSTPPGTLLIFTADAEQLTLRLALKDGEAEQRFRVASVPFTCPDMPR